MHDLFMNIILVILELLSLLLIPDVLVIVKMSIFVFFIY